MFAKNDKGYIPYVENYLMLIATNLTSIYCIYKKKIVKNDIESSDTCRPTNRRLKCIIYEQIKTLYENQLNIPMRGKKSMTIG